MAERDLGREASIGILADYVLSVRNRGVRIRDVVVEELEEAIVLSCDENRQRQVQADTLEAFDDECELVFDYPGLGVLSYDQFRRVAKSPLKDGEIEIGYVKERILTRFMKTPRICVSAGDFDDDYPMTDGAFKTQITLLRQKLGDTLIGGRNSNARFRLIHTWGDGRYGLTPRMAPGSRG
jgi:hypothetical protein